MLIMGLDGTLPRKIAKAILRLIIGRSGFTAAAFLVTFFGRAQKFSVLVDLRPTSILVGF